MRQREAAKLAGFEEVDDAPIGEAGDDEVGDGGEVLFVVERAEMRADLREKLGAFGIPRGTLAERLRRIGVFGYFGHA
jgi:hypothetical protein